MGVQEDEKNKNMIELNKNEIYSLEGLNEEQLRKLAEKADIDVERLKIAEYIRFNNNWCYGWDISKPTAKAIDLFEVEKENNAHVWNTFGSKEEFNNFIKELQVPAEDRIKAIDLFENNEEKPSQYNIGIDTFERCEANMTKEETLACCKFNIDKYNWRKKGQDKEDFEKIINYAKWALEQFK